MDRTNQLKTDVGGSYKDLLHFEKGLMQDLDNYKIRIVVQGGEYKILCGGLLLAKALVNRYVLYQNPYDGTWYIGSYEHIIHEELTEKLYKKAYWLVSDKVLSGKYYTITENLEITKEYIR